MLHYDDDSVRRHLFDGLIGLEKEGLRVTGDGFFAQTPHPFPVDDLYVVRDFCENQTEINTPPKDSANEAYEELKYQTQRIVKRLGEMEVKEYLWPFSNPPYILDEESIPIAQYYGEDRRKTEYREYLAERYGRYKMTFCGIHFNYSFSDELLERDMVLSKGSDLRSYKDDFYVHLAAKAQIYNWLVVAVTAASPLLDSSYFEKGRCGSDVYNGMASSRCSEIGYWNFFTPLLDYTDMELYVRSIDSIVGYELIRSSSELYFPVRVKPAGSYSHDALAERGADHIELRMIDLNPLDEAGVDVRDVFFLQLFLIYLACSEGGRADADVQIKAIANTKNAARFDLKTVHLIGEEGKTPPIADAAIEVIDEMIAFYEGFGRKDILEDLSYQRSKFTEMKNRYAWKVREQYSGGYVQKGLKMLKGESRKVESLLRTLLYEKYIEPTRGNRNNYIGIEIEMPIVNLHKEAVDFANVHRVTAKFMEHLSQDDHRPEKRGP